MISSHIEFLRRIYLIADLIGRKLVSTPAYKGPAVQSHPQQGLCQRPLSYINSSRPAQLSSARTRSLFNDKGFVPATHLDPYFCVRMIRPAISLQNHHFLHVWDKFLSIDFLSVCSRATCKGFDNSGNHPTAEQITEGYKSIYRKGFHKSCNQPSSQRIQHPVF